MKILKINLEMIHTWCPEFVLQERVAVCYKTEINHASEEPKAFIYMRGVIWLYAIPQ